jgi:hypothetical protein
MVVSAYAYGGQAFLLQALLGCCYSPVALAFSIVGFRSKENRRALHALVATTAVHLSSIVILVRGFP